MQALALEAFDVPPAVIDISVPEPGPGEVLVRVHASSVNAFDVGVAAGFMKDYMPYEFPAVIGNDVAGVIESIGDGVEGSAVGDRVFGMMDSKGTIHDGSWGELATRRRDRSPSLPRDCRISTPARSPWPGRRR